MVKMNDVVLKENGRIDPQGVCTMRAFERGVIPGLMERGMDLQSAMKMASISGKLRCEKTTHNLVVTAGKVLVANYLKGDALSLNGITYFAIGSGVTTPSASDTQLTTEVIRKAITLKGLAGTILTLSTFFLAATCNFYVKEAGLFGEAASLTLNSGTLFSHFLQSYDNSAGENDLTFEYNLTVGG